MTDAAPGQKLAFSPFDIFAGAHLTHFDGDGSGDAIKPPQSDIATGRFTLGTHGSQLEAMNKATLLVSNNAHGHLRADFSGERMESDVRSGMLTFAPANTVQTYDFAGRTTNTALTIDQELLERVAKTDPRLGSVGGFEPRVSFVRPALQHLVEEQYEVMASADAGWRVLSESIALRIAYELLMTFNGDEAKKAGAPPLSQHEIGELIDFIDAEMESNFGLNEMAAILNRDPFGFSRSFKAATGESPHQFVIRRRLAKVKNMLSGSKMPLAEIAYATGFANQSHMTATFSKHFGLPPGQYRKAIRS